MMKTAQPSRISATLAAISILSGFSAYAAPLKVYILAGQSNMEGHAKVETFDAIGLDPKTAPMLKEMRGADGEPRVLDDVWISYLHNKRGAENGVVKSGKLTTGYGAQNDIKIGPEYTFGIYMSKATEAPILLIKTAWGGKSLHTDFRPPGAGHYELNDHQKELYKKQGKDIAQIAKEKVEHSGFYYRAMIEHVQQVLAAPGNTVEGYDPKDGIELAGFVWFQGFNDLVDSHTYPQRGKPGGYDLYSELLETFINDVRKDLNAPELPFVIGVLGVGGPADPQDKKSASKLSFQNAMAAPADLPEFKNTVTAVWTDQYWDQELDELSNRLNDANKKIKELSNGNKLKPDEKAALTEKVMAEFYTDREIQLLKGRSNQAYHYLGSAKILGQIGKAFADAMIELGKLD
ncbi:MAG: sialate O-acetylesterase [Luteolibacter sp.]